MKKVLVTMSLFACFHVAASDKVVIKDLTTSSNKTKYTLIIHTSVPSTENKIRPNYRCSIRDNTCFESRSPVVRALRKLD